MARIYDDIRWDSVRESVIARDGNCVLSWLGPCSGPLHVHHVSYEDPYDENVLVTVCRRHHGAADRLRRFSSKWKRCPHVHRTREGRESCERKLNAAA